MANDIDLKGRTAVVTGGAQGFGKAITERFLKSGARVAIWDQDIALARKTAQALGGDVEAVACDVSDPAAVAKARDATTKALGRIDILVNNAGIAGVNAKTWETDVEEWRKVMRINLDGPFICSRAVVPLMIAQNYGRIVNIASLLLLPRVKGALVGLQWALYMHGFDGPEHVDVVEPMPAAEALHRSPSR